MKPHIAHFVQPPISLWATAERLEKDRSKTRRSTLSCSRTCAWVDGYVTGNYVRLMFLVKFSFMLHVRLEIVVDRARYTAKQERESRPPTEMARRRAT